MDLFIDRDELSRGLARVQGIIERRSTHPMLAFVLLKAADQGLTMTATDTEVAFIGELAANVEAPGNLAVDAASLFQIVRALPDSTVQLTVNAANRLEIRSGRAFFKLPGRPAEDYPALPAFDERGSIQIKESDLRRMVEQVQLSVSADDMRYGLNGAFLEERPGPEGAHLRMVATDGHRLSSAEAAVEGTIEITPRTLVPRKALAVLKKLLGGSHEPVELSFGEGALRLKRPGQTFWFRLLDGEFPDYNAVVPSAHMHRVRVQRNELMSTLKRVGILVQDRNRAVRFAFQDGELEIGVQNDDRGEVSETLAIELEGEAVTVGFNGRYLQDVLGVMQAETVTLELYHSLAPCLVQDPDRVDSFFVVMPMRLD